MFAVHRDRKGQAGQAAGLLLSILPIVLSLARALRRQVCFA
jgi:hypothetical protein